MAINKAMVTGTNGVMDWFNRNATSPYYSVWSGRQLLFSWNDDDLEKGSNKLENDLIAIEDNGVGDLLTIKLHPKKEKGGFITDKTPIYASLNFRPAALERSNMYGVPQMVAGVGNSKLEQMMQQMIENQNLLISQMSANNEEEEEETPKSTIGALLEHPQVQALLIAGASKLLGVGNIENPAAIAGINDGTENEAIEILGSLMSKGVTVDHLRKLNEMSSAKLQSLLLML